MASDPPLESLPDEGKLTIRDLLIIDVRNNEISELLRKKVEAWQAWCIAAKICKE